VKKGSQWEKLHASGQPVCKIRTVTQQARSPAALTVEKKIVNQAGNRRTFKEIV